MKVVETIEPRKAAVQEIDYLKVLKILLSRWYWIAGTVIAGLIIAHLYLWYTPPVYSTSASLKFDEKRSEISELIKVSSYYDRTNKVESESFVIRSRPVLLNAISRLQYDVSYYLNGRVRISELYPQVPFPITIISKDTASHYSGLISYAHVSDQTFRLSFSVKDEQTEKRYRYGDTILLKGIRFRVGKPKSFDRSEYSFRFNRPEDFYGRVAAGLSMKPANKSSNVLLLTANDRNPRFAADILNSILREYVSYDAAQKSMSATQTIKFIEDQLEFLSGEVDYAGSALERFKEKNGLVNLPTTTDLNVGKLSQQESQKNLLKIQELAITQLEKQVASNKKQVGLNFNLEGAVDPLLAGLINQLNTLIVEKEKKLIIFNASSAPVQDIERQIATIRSAIADNIRLQRQRNAQTIRYIDQQITKAQKTISKLPAAERDFVNLQTAFNINQKVYSYLSEKKLEAQISRAAVVPGATIIEEAPEVGTLIAPVPRKVYVSAVILGLLCGVGLIILKRISNPYIYDKETVESLTNAPIIGIIRKFPGHIDLDNRQILSIEKPKSIFAESVRSVRTNLSFLASEKASKVICVTSEIAGEGKSFVTINLASTLALIDKKVLLIATDLRRSKLHKTFDTSNIEGLSTYLSNQSVLEKIIVRTNVPGLDFIPSGPVPPNPSELLHSEKMKDMIRDLSGPYDFILLDTAPVGLVSDSIPLIRLSDVNLYVIRSGVSRFNSATIPDRLCREYSLNNVVVVLNAFGDDALHSRYFTTNYTTSYYSNYYYYSDYSGYSSSGYYAEEEKSKFWQIWKKTKNV
ncbi:MAG TPA: polysaccharide biosynthesis tyrosine autokinase [Sphingobacteriaceae bacterium]